MNIDYYCHDCAVGIKDELTLHMVQMETNDKRLNRFRLQHNRGFCGSCEAMTTFVVFSIAEFLVPKPVDDLVSKIAHQRKEVLEFSVTPVPSIFSGKRWSYYKNRERACEQLRLLESQMLYAEYEQYEINSDVIYARTYWADLNKSPVCVKCNFSRKELMPDGKSLMNHRCGNQISIEETQKSWKHSGVKGMRVVRGNGRYILVDENGEFTLGSEFFPGLMPTRWGGTEEDYQFCGVNPNQKSDS